MMKSLKTNITFLLLVLSITLLNAQREMKSVEGYAPKIGSMVYMLEDLKDRITEQVKDLDQSQVDFMYDANANSNRGIANASSIYRIVLSNCNLKR